MPDEDQKDDHAAAASPQRSSRPSWPLVTARRLACSRWPIPRLRASPLSAGSVRLRAPCLRSSSSFRRGGAGVQVGSPPAIADPSYAHQLPHRPISYPIIPSATPSSHHPVRPSSHHLARPSAHQVGRLTLWQCCATSRCTCSGSPPRSSLWGSSQVPFTLPSTPIIGSFGVKPDLHSAGMLRTLCSGGAWARSVGGTPQVVSSKWRKWCK